VSSSLHAKTIRDKFEMWATTTLHIATVLHYLHGSEMSWVNLKIQAS
jgi:hypothetical protein